MFSVEQSVIVLSIQTNHKNSSLKFILNKLFTKEAKIYNPVSSNYFDITIICQTGVDGCLDVYYSDSNAIILSVMRVVTHRGNKIHSACKQFYTIFFYVFENSYRDFEHNILTVLMVLANTTYVLSSILKSHREFEHFCAKCIYWDPAEKCTHNILHYMNICKCSDVI